VARGFLREDALLYTGRTAEGSLTSELPMPVAALLEEPARRHALEAPVAGALAAFAWERSVALQKALFDALLRERGER